MCLPIVRLTSLTLLLSLAACGFHLRGTGGQVFSVERIHVSAGDASGELRRDVEGILAQSGASIIERSEAPYLLNLVSERFSRRPISTTSQISVAEYELTMEVEFSLEDQVGEMIIPVTLLTLARTYTFDAESLVGSSEEEALLKEEMRRETAARLIRQIDAAIRSGEAAVDEDPA
ncbi:MAG: LPS assembly lipoprotein LptE [Pseudomonadales bacterium]